jgi:hypothetical protein
VPENSGCNGSDDSLAYTIPSPIMPDSGLSEKLKNLRLEKFIAAPVE